MEMRGKKRRISTACWSTMTSVGSGLARRIIEELIARARRLAKNAIVLSFIRTMRRRSVLTTQAGDELPRRGEKPSGADTGTVGSFCFMRRRSDAGRRFETALQRRSAGTRFGRRNQAEGRALCPFAV